MRGLAILLALALAGCQSYDIVQTNVFSNEDGDVVYVGYGRSDKDHVNTFRSPVTGATMPFKSKLLVKVELPDGDTFKAWQCMNFLQAGTMYKTDDEEWMFHANGFTCGIYHQSEDPTKYLEVYRGVICETPKSDYKPSDKWRKLKKDGKGRWR